MGAPHNKIGNWGNPGSVAFGCALLRVQLSWRAVLIGTSVLVGLVVKWW
jgi:hypothetical protein